MEINILSQTRLKKSIDDICELEKCWVKLNEKSTNILAV